MADNESFSWVEEINRQQSAPVGLKRKARSKKMDYVGWGSKLLIEFLQSIGVDTSKQISRYDVTDIITKYVNDHSLHHPKKKKKIVCDEWLLSLFGRKTISRIRIYDLLESHFAENLVGSDDDFCFSSEEDEHARDQQGLSLDKKPATKKASVEAPKSCFAAIVPDNVKLVYLRRSLVQELLKDPETFKAKVLGSFVRIKADPNDYLQKNSHLLVQVTGLKKASDDENAEILLQVSTYMKDISISMLSDDNFSEEECTDLRERVRDRLLKRPTVVELEEKVRVLHHNVTKHWLVRELALLQKLIDRANDKGWRKELFEYLERRELLQTPDEQSRLLSEVPNVIADDIEVQAKPQEFPDNLKKENNGSPKSIPSKVAEIPRNVAASGASSTWTNCSSNSRVDNQVGLTATNEKPGIGFPHDILPSEKQERPKETINDSDDEIQLLNIEETKKPDGAVDKHVIPVITLSDDDDDEDVEENDTGARVQVLDCDLESYIWYYADPQGDTQGPFSIMTLKRWSDRGYFPPDFKVWTKGKSQKESVLLSHLFRLAFSK